MSVLRPQFPDRTHELQYVAEDGSLIHATASDYADGFESQLQNTVEHITLGQQIVVFENGSPRYVIELDFDENEVITEIT